MSKDLDLSLYLILDPPMCGGFTRTLEKADQAMSAGVTCIQLRAPTWKKKAWFAMAVALKPLCKFHHVPLIINDHVDIALAMNADGVHLGQDDLPIAAARSILGNNKIIGLSTTHLKNVEEANNLPIDYIGIGPIFDTTTKKDAKTAIGFATATQMVSHSHKPSVLIGGLKLNHVLEAKQTGAQGICVVSAICAAEDVTAITKQMIHVWSNTINE